AGAGRREGHDVLGSVVAQIPAAESAEENAGGPEEPGAFNLALVRPARRAIGGHESVLACSPQRADNGRAAPHEAADGGQHTCPIEYVRSVGPVRVPPLEQFPGLIDWRAEQHDPGRAQLRLVA